MKAIIVDDEPALRQQLLELLNECWAELDVVAEAGDGLSALEIMKQETLDIAFLDIQMPGLDGLQLAQQIKGDVQIVFITAYDEYAVAAFEREAVDYILKPVTKKRLEETIKRLKRAENTINQADLSALIKQITPEKKQALKWLKALKGDVLHLIDIDQVLYFQAGDKYTTVVNDEGEFLIRKPIKALENELDDQQFWRINRGIIIKVKSTKAVKRELNGSYLVWLHGVKQPLKASRNYAHLFKQM
ncbi:MAG: response regulator transcription factor [Gammaproteobacteria bacterium]|nr:response regulator transcription factor [Gammaproteobacteria bacterium]